MTAVPDHTARTEFDAPGWAEFVSALDVPQPFDLAVFAERLGARLERRIRLHPHRNIPAGLCGLWVRLPESDHIFFEAGTSALHRTHIVFHEIGHILLGHHTRAEGSVTGALLDSLAAAARAAEGTAPTGRALPFLSGLGGGASGRSAVEIMMGRSSFDTPDEQEAEQLADILADRCLSPRVPRPAGPVDRIGSAFTLR